SNTVGSVTGGPYCNAFWPDELAPEKPLATLEEFIFSKETTIRFAHADLIPKNIIIEESTTTDIGDWALSGFFPDFLEYGRMRDPAVMVFPGPRRQAEINSLRRLLQIL
ncbi:hypothetical protein EDD18DRAFT_1055376, partial [Armillaria luteobubalina]